MIRHQGLAALGVAAAIVLGGASAGAVDRESYERQLIELGNKSDRMGPAIVATGVTFPAPCKVFIRFAWEKGSDQVTRSWLFDAASLTKIAAVRGDRPGILLKGGDGDEDGPKITMSQRQIHNGKVTRGSNTSFETAMNFPIHPADVEPAVKLLQGLQQTCQAEQD